MKIIAHFTLYSNKKLTLDKFRQRAIIIPNFKRVDEKEYPCETAQRAGRLVKDRRGKRGELVSPAALLNGE